MALQRYKLVDLAREQAVKVASIKNPEFVIIGDSPGDVECAKLSGSRSIAVATGSYNAKQLSDAGADLTIDSFNDFSTVINFICS